MPDFLAEVLTWPSNYYYSVAVETAVKMGIPPTSLLSEEQPTKKWSSADKKLAMAWTVLQRETCNKCGQPLWICRSSNKDLGFRIRRGKCYSSSELEKWQKSKAGETLKPGEYGYAVPYMRDESNLPSRKAYLAELADE